MYSFEPAPPDGVFQSAQGLLAAFVVNLQTQQSEQVRLTNFASRIIGKPTVDKRAMAGPRSGQQG